MQKGPTFVCALLYGLNRNVRREGPREGGGGFVVLTRTIVPVKGPLDRQQASGRGRCGFA